MDRELTELRSSPDEGALRGGERQARSAFRLARQDPTLIRLAIGEAVALTALGALFLLLSRKSGSVDRGADRAFANLLYPLFFLGITTVFSVAVAFAADARIDGFEGDLRIAFGEVWKRLPTIICWWLISIGVVIALSVGAKEVMRPLPALLIVSILWGIANFFVVPAIALEGRGALRSLRGALRMLGARWGRALAGLFAIGFLSGLAFLACAALLRVTAEHHPRSPGESPWRYAAPLFAFYLVYAAMATTRGSFAVILARDALDDLPGEPPPMKPRPRRATIVRRIVFAAFALALGLLVLGAVVSRHR